MIDEAPAQLGLFQFPTGSGCSLSQSWLLHQSFTWNLEPGLAEDHTL